MGFLPLALRNVSDHDLALRDTAAGKSGRIWLFGKGELAPGQQRKAAVRDRAALSVCRPHLARSVDSRQDFELTTQETDSVARAGTPKCPQALSGAILGSLLLLSRRRSEVY